MAISVAVLANAGSGLFLRLGQPSLALRFNPLNAEARIELIIEKLEAVSNDALRAARDLALTGVRLSRADARFYSLIGVVDLREGNGEDAQRLFGIALKHQPTEILALGQKLRFAVDTRDLVSAVDCLELIARRWPEHWSVAGPVLPVILSDKAAFETLAARFGDAARLRWMVIDSLVGSPESLSLAYRLIMVWAGQEDRDLSPEINRLTSRFISEGRYADAFILFGLTRRGENAKTGYVYNGGFEQPFSGNPFDWRLRRQAGVEIARTVDRSRQASDDDRARLAIRFLDNPIQFNGISQLLRLAPARYELTVRYGTRHLEMPKPLKLAVTCVDSRTPLAEIILEEGTAEKRRSTAAFGVPDGGCGLQRLAVFNEQLPMSWRNRYDGRLFLNDVAVHRTGG